MSLDWTTLITVSASEQGWLNPNVASVTKVNSVRDFLTLPYGEHKSIAIWLQETPGVYTGTVPNAVYYPSLSLKAAVIDQTRVTTEQNVDPARIANLSEALSYDDSGTLNLALAHGPIHAVMLRENIANNTAAFLVSFDWGTQDTSGIPLAASHQLIYCTVSGPTITVSHVYTDPDQSATSQKCSLLMGGGTTDRAIWMKSKTGGDLHTAKVITTSSASSTITVGATNNDLPASHTSLFGYLCWYGDSGGFIYNATGSSSAVQQFSSAPGSDTIAFVGTEVSIPTSSYSNVKLLGGQRIQNSGGIVFTAMGVEETFEAQEPDQGLNSYTPSITYDSIYTYDSSGTGGIDPPPPPTGDIGSYDDPEVYDEPVSYDDATLNQPGEDDIQILEPYARVYVISLAANTFTVQTKSGVGQFYRTTAITAEDIVLGTGMPIVAAYQSASRGSALAVVNSAHDALLPLSTSRWFGQEVTFDPVNAPLRKIYPNSTVPFSNKYANNAEVTSVGMALVNSGAYAYYSGATPGTTSLDRPLRVTYFENAFTTSTTPAFPGTGDPGTGDPGTGDPGTGDPGTGGPGDGGDPGVPLDYAGEALQVAVERLFGATSPGTMVCLDGDIILNNLVLNTIDSDGVLWLCTGIEGWWTTPDAATHDHPRGQRDGSYDTDGRYGARIITLNGVFLPPHRGKVIKARDRLIRAINIAREPGYLRTSDDVRKRESRVWLSGRPEIETVNQKGKTEFSIGLRAPDPIKYEVVNASDPSQNFRQLATTLSLIADGRTYNKTYDWDYNYDAENPTGSLNVINYGNDTVYPVITVTGRLAAGARVVNYTTNEALTILDLLPQTSTLVIDSLNRTVTLDGATSMRGKLSVDSDWISLAPGTNSVNLLGSNAGSGTDSPPRLTVTWRSGWIG